MPSTPPAAKLRAYRRSIGTAMEGRPYVLEISQEKGLLAEIGEYGCGVRVRLTER